MVALKSLQIMKFLKNLREIVLDTETTGLDFANGDRIVDIACVELINHVRTENEYHVYINPERKMSEESVRITGITDEFLLDKPKFKDIVDDFLNFVQDSPLVIHNAKFDIDFLNSELQRIDKPLFKLEDAVDTLIIARQKFPGAASSLDALCRRFGVDTSIREVHGALVDCYLLAEVYINLLGGKQAGLVFDESKTENVAVRHKKERIYREIRSFPPSAEELSEHAAFLQQLNEAMWGKVIKSRF